ncbi:MAG: oligoendopeptidase F [Bacillota bacterium]
MSGAHDGRRVPSRQEVAQEHRWALETVYADDAAWEQDFAEVKGLLPQAGAWMERGLASAANLAECLALRDKAGTVMDRLFGYAHMRRDEDTTHSGHQAMAERAAALNADFGQAFAFLRPAILAIPAEELSRFLEDEPRLAMYRHLLDDITRLRPHTLSAPEEHLVAAVSELASVPYNVHGMLSQADMRFLPITGEDGEPAELTASRYGRYRQSQVRRVRQESFERLHEGYAKLENTFAAILGGGVKANVFHAKARQFPSALSASLSAANIPTEVYAQLVATVQANLGLLHRYFSLRQQVLGLADGLHMWDLYVPLVKGVDQHIPWQKAMAMVRDGLKALGEEYCSVMGDGLKGRWVDVFENQNKRSGAYSWGSYGTPPFILLNYDGSLSEVFTLAHELGHSMHTCLSGKRQPYVYSAYPMFLAEVASTVNEVLLTDALLEASGDRATTLYLINSQLEQIRTTVFRQTMFAEFERDIHALVEGGGALTPEVLKDRYRELNRLYHGPGVALDEGIAVEWARIPHFFMNFYVYQYATGYSAAVAIARGIGEIGRPAVEAYLDFLSAGGSGYPIDLLQRAGVDMTSPRPVEACMAKFAELLDRFESLL